MSRFRLFCVGKIKKQIIQIYLKGVLITEIEKRSIGMCIFLSIITFGIYAIYWLVKLAKESVSVKDEHDSGTLEAVLSIFLPFIGFYLAEKKFYQGWSQEDTRKKTDLLFT